MATDQDPYDLQRFLDAQAGVYARVCAELRAGRKQSHWMWFVFPQLAGLGTSAMAQRYAIVSLAEAKAYLDHPVLGFRLRECVGLVNAVEGRTVEAIFGHPDDRKFHSSLTLFLHATDNQQVFQDALDKYFAGTLDPLTIARL